MSEVELLQERPYPEGTATLGDKTVYRWPDLEVIVIEGVIEKVRVFDESRREEINTKRNEKRFLREQEKKEREEENSRKAVQLYEKRKAAEERKQRTITALKTHLEAERERWEFKEREMKRMGRNYRKIEDFQEMRELYLDSMERKLIAIYNGDTRAASACRKERSRYELDLNKLSDEILEDDTIDMRIETFGR